MLLRSNANKNEINNVLWYLGQENNIIIYR